MDLHEKWAFCPNWQSFSKLTEECGKVKTAMAKHSVAEVQTRDAEAELAKIVTLPEKCLLMLPERGQMSCHTTSLAG